MILDYFFLKSIFTQSAVHTNVIGRLFEVIFSSLLCSLVHSTTEQFRRKDQHSLFPKGETADFKDPESGEISLKSMKSHLNPKIH